MKSFEGRVAIITVVGDGIGEAIAVSFAEEGAGIIVLNFNPEAAHRTARELNHYVLKVHCGLVSIMVRQVKETMVVQLINKYLNLDFDSTDLYSHFC